MIVLFFFLVVLHGQIKLQIYPSGEKKQLIRGPTSCYYARVKNLTDAGCIVIVATIS